jgi:hypothetical protein
MDPDLELDPDPPLAKRLDPEHCLKAPRLRQGCGPSFWAKNKMFKDIIVPKILIDFVIGGNRFKHAVIILSSIATTPSHGYFIRL